MSRVSNVEHLTFVPRRCVAVSLAIGSLNLNILNVHNYMFTAQQVAGIGRHLANWQSRTVLDPKRNFSMVLGDLNFPGANDRVFNPCVISESEVVEIPIHFSTLHFKWKSVLSNWTELVQPLPTHFNPRGPSLKRLDRAWVDMPAHLIGKI